MAGAATALLLATTSSAALGQALPDDSADAEHSDIVVTASGDLDRARAELARIPGSASVVDNSVVERGRASNAEDVLAFVPGVFAAATSGNSANKISIRGSGLNTFYQGYSLGLRYLYDGLPITGPGGTQEDLLNVAAVDHTEILNGSNAFSYGALSLGGAINFITHTGRTSPGFFASAEIGSYGHRKYQASAGAVIGDTDIYASVLRNEREGFQRDSPNKGEDYIFNIGHQVNDRLAIRFIARHRWEHLFNGSTLSLAQIEADPRQNRLISGRRKKGTTLLIGKIDYEVDDRSRLEFGVGYNHYPLYNGWKTVAPQDWRSTDLSVSLRYLRHGDTLFGLPLDTTLAFSGTWLVDGDVTGYDIVGEDTNFRQYTKYTGSRDISASLNNVLHLDDRLSVSTGLSVINVKRDVRILETVRANTTDFPLAVNYDKAYFAPRIGLLYDAGDAIQLFGNVTKSVDPPVTWQLGSTGNPYVRPLNPQRATTAEIGARAGLEGISGSLTLYRTWVKDELLTVIIQPATETSEAVTANANASPTIHQGIEAALQWRLWQNDAGHSVNLRQTYTYSDFHYRHDPDFGDNLLPSLPDHVYQAELQYDHRLGFYAGVNVRAMSGYFVDYANTLRAPSVTIWGAKLGYADPDGRYRAYLDFRNIGDKRYPAAANTAYDLHGVDSPNFYPGDGFAVYGGVAFRL